MIRINGVNIPHSLNIDIGLQKIYGIGSNNSKLICKNIDIIYKRKVKDLTNIELVLLRKEVNKVRIEGELRKILRTNIKNLIDMKCYRGVRHQRGLPCRGQRTRTNAKTCKGLKKNIVKKK